MKILFINTFYYPYEFGGAERSVRSIVESMQSLGHETRVLSFAAKPLNNFDTTLDSNRFFKSVNLYLPNGQPSKRLTKFLWHLLDIFNPVAFLLALKEIREYNPDVISIHNLYGWSLAPIVAALACKKKYICVLHDYYLFCLTGQLYRKGSACTRQCITCKIMRIPHKIISNTAETVVGISDYILNHFLNSGYFKPSNKLRIYNTLGSTQTYSRLHDKISSNSSFCFGFLGRVCRYKGIEILLEAFSICRFPPYVSLKIAGIGEPDYVRYLKQNYNHENIIFCGKVESTAFLSTLDCLVVPSLSAEALGRVVFEAILSGTRVLGSNIGGIPEMIDNKTNGRTFTPGDTHELSMLMQSELQHCGNYNRQKISETLNSFNDLSTFRASYNSCYSGCIDNKTLLT